MDVRAKLIEAGENLSDEAQEAVLALGADAVPALIAVFQDPDLRAEDSPGEGWAPVHAAQLLGELADPRAVEPLLQEVLEGDWASYLSNAASVALPRHGAAALEPLLRAHDAEDDAFERALLCLTLADLGVRDERVYERLIACMRSHPDIGASSLGAYGDTRAVPLLYEAFDAVDLEGPSPEPRVIVEIAAALSELDADLDEAREAKLEAARRTDGAFGAFRSAAQRLILPAGQLLSLSAALVEGRRSLWNVRGALCALATRPSPLQGAALVGLLPPEGMSEEALGALMQLHNATIQALGVPPEHEKGGDLDPTDLCPPPDNVNAAREFCLGYTEIAAQDPAWPDDREMAGLMVPVLLAGGALEADDGDEAANARAEELAQSARADLPNVIAEIYDELAPLRRSLARPMPTSSTKVGRNAPCPCGSGRKHKRCCGAAA